MHCSQAVTALHIALLDCLWFTIFLMFVALVIAVHQNLCHDYDINCELHCSAHYELQWLFLCLCRIDVPP